MEKVFLRLLFILLAFSCLVAFSTVTPIAKKGTKELPTVTDTSEWVAYGEITAEEGIEGRMQMEINDYPGIGANNRHTPKPPARS